MLYDPTGDFIQQCRPFKTAAVSVMLSGSDGKSAPNHPGRSDPVGVAGVHDTVRPRTKQHRCARSPHRVREKLTVSSWNVGSLLKTTKPAKNCLGCKGTRPLWNRSSSTLGNALQKCWRGNGEYVHFLLVARLKCSQEDLWCLFCDISSLGFSKHATNCFPPDHDTVVSCPQDPNHHNSKRLRSDTPSIR